MAKNYKVTPRAAKDVKGIIRYIGEDSPKASKDMKDRLFLAFSNLAENPYMGHKREDLTDKPVLFWSVCHYMIIYNPNSDPLEIIRIMSGFRDIPSFI